ncbi:hypothetical protein NM208_g5813 [Fusarium decemcellulare]|uniref:Uncharacterized protein n=1 Tax=Fusarium decemcellulare TaxID=57161 RepID=A0ACC1SFM1_9HYPO|nr:hypothetical protein NM208_g5813 [Fusarium decemcellulare]
MSFELPLPPSVQKSQAETKVRYVQVGKSGLRVSWPILGCMTLGSSGAMPWNLDEEESLKVLKAAYDNGVNTWDTANCYGNGINEELIGKAIKQFGIPRHKLTILSKCYYEVGEEDDVFSFGYGSLLKQDKNYVNQGGLSRTAIFNQVEASLTRLGTSYIDLYQIHRLDESTPMEEIMKALHDLVQSGKVRYIGASAMLATQFAQMQFIAEKNGWTKFISVQNYYNLCFREEEREMIRFCKATGVGIIPFSPMYAGKLAKPLGTNDSVRSQIPFPLHPFTKADEEIIRRVEKIANDKGWKMAHVALLWHQSKGTIPIVGVNSVKRLEDLGPLKDKELSKEDLEYLEEPYEARAPART